MMSAGQAPVTMLEATSDTRELSAYKARRQRFERNLAWFLAHAVAIYTTCRGKCICVAGEELFVSDTPRQVLDQARAAHPEDDGRFTRLIPRERTARIYANLRHVAGV